MIRFVVATAIYAIAVAISLAMGVAGVFFDGTPLPMVAGITLCAVISFTLAKVTLGRSREAATRKDAAARP